MIQERTVKNINFDIVKSGIIRTLLIFLDLTSEE